MRKLVILLLTAVSPILERAAHGQLVIHVVDVGQGEAILLEFKSAAILIDAGGEDTGDNRYRNHLLSELNKFFTRRKDLSRTLQAVIITHPHIDHTRFVMDVLNASNTDNFTVKNFYDGGEMNGGRIGLAPVKDARTYAKAHGIQYAAIRDDVIGQDGFTPVGLKKLSPDIDIRFLTGSRDCANPNNNSLVVRVHYGDKTALFTGDSETDDDDGCEEGQVEHLLERYEGTDLLRADVYKVGHHGSHNGTDEALVSAVSPTIALISAGRKETRAPTPFHAFFFGHPREDVVELLEATTGNRNPPVMAYTYLKGTKKKDATNTIIEGRLVAKAIYCTCWDGDLTVSMDSSGAEFSVAAADRQPLPPGDQPSLMNVVETRLPPTAQPFQFASTALANGPNFSYLRRTEEMIVFFFMPFPIYIAMRVHEIRRERLRKQIAAKLIKTLDHGWKFTLFELGALIRRSNSQRLIFENLWPRPRISIDEVLEQAVAELVDEGTDGSARVAVGSQEQKKLINKLKQFHSDPKSLMELPGSLPSTRFIVAAVPVIVLVFAIQEFPLVGTYLAKVFNHNSFPEEFWAGLLATVVGTGATLLGKRSIHHREAEGSTIKSRDQKKWNAQDNEGQKTS